MGQITIESQDKTVKQGFVLPRNGETSTRGIENSKMSIKVSKRKILPGL